MDGHGIGGTRRKIRVWNCGQAAGAIDHNESEWPRGLHANLQIDSLGGRAGIIETPMTRLMPARLRGLAEIMPIDARAEHFGLREANVQSSPVSWRRDAQVKRSRRAVRRIVEQLRLGRRQRNRGSFVLKKSDGIPVRNEVGKFSARRRGAEILSGPIVDTVYGASPEGFASVSVQRVGKQAGFGMIRRVTSSLRS